MNNNNNISLLLRKCFYILDLKITVVDSVLSSSLIYCKINLSSF